ncbi:MAG: hypothetical protein ACRDS9_11545 [Pseudonocardiaceae bacterium]
MQASGHCMLLNCDKSEIHVLPMPLLGNLDLDLELDDCAQQVDVRLSASLRPLILSLSIGLSLLAPNVGSMSQRDSTESPEKRTSRRDDGRDNREVGHEGSLYASGRIM